MAGNIDESVSNRWRVAALPASNSEEIQFSNQNAHLAGTLYLPRTGDHLPALVALHSAGAATRAAGLYRHLRESLPAMGFAVLIYDRRGSGNSSGDLSRSDFETLADDAVAAQQALSKHPRIDPKKIGFWGLSQGGWLAILASVRSPKAAFAISVSAPLVNAEEQMEFATTNLLLLRKYSESDVQQMLVARTKWVGFLRGQNSRDEAEHALQQVESKPWFSLVYLPKAADLGDSERNAAIRRQSDDDPVAALHKAKVPVLFLYGDSDPWVPVAKSIERLQSLALPNVEFAVVQFANHEMMSPINENMEVTAETLRTDQPQAAGYFMVLGSWLARRFRSPMDR